VKEDPQKAALRRRTIHDKESKLQRKEREKVEKYYEKYNITKNTIV
jgi:hypothetical protein